MSTNDNKAVLRGELALVLVVVINSLGVLLMLHSGSGISAISSVPYAFNLVLPKLSLGTWTYIFQGLLICALYAHAPQICSGLFIQFCCRICLW